MAFNFQRLEHVRIGLALVAAVITGGAALYGVYVNAREATAASYETLAPEINALKQAVARLEQENEQLRRAMDERPASTPVPQPAAARSAPRRPRAPAQQAPSRDAPPPTTVPAETPPAAPPPAPAPPAEAERRVPIDFEKARDIWREVRKNLPRRE